MIIDAQCLFFGCQLIWWSDQLIRAVRDALSLAQTLEALLHQKRKTRTFHRLQSCRVYMFILFIQQVPKNVLAPVSSPTTDYFLKVGFTYLANFSRTNVCLWPVSNTWTWDFSVRFVRLDVINRNAAVIAMKNKIKTIKSQVQACGQQLPRCILARNEDFSNYDDVTFDVSNPELSLICVSDWPLLHSNGGRGWWGS